MIGLDTNVLVRYIMQDDATQAPKATKLIEGLSSDSPGYVPVVAVVELVWVLSSSFGLQRAQIVKVLEILLRSEQLLVDQAEHVVRATRAYSGGSADFADCLIERTASAAGCSQTMTFDLAAAKSAGMSLVP